MMLSGARRDVMNVGAPSSAREWRRPAPPQHRARVAAELAKLIVNGATFMKLVRAAHPRWNLNLGLSCCPAQAVAFPAVHLHGGFAKRIGRPSVTDVIQHAPVLVMRQHAPWQILASSCSCNKVAGC